MVRSLYSGISGLRNHQVAMDVVGNNIANVNTTGFKSGRVTFEESMAQLLKGASRPPGNSGGTNPIQVGLGMSIGSIDTLLTQGNLQATGQLTDLALEGRAYFVFNSGEGNFFSRNGALQMDSTGRLVSPTNGFTLQGMMADYDGTYPTGTTVGDIRVPFGEKAPANATTEVGYSSNLDSDSEALGTVVHSNRFLADAETTDSLTSLFDQNGNSLGMRIGDTLTVSVTDAADITYTADYLISDTTNLAIREISTYADLAGVIQALLTTNIDGAITVTPQADGTIEIDSQFAAGGTEINNLTVNSSRPGSNSFVANMFSWGPTLTGGNAGTDVYYTVNALRAPATETDLLADVYDASGNLLGLEDDTATGGTQDVITINGSIGGDAITPVLVNYTNVMTLADLITEIRSAFNLPQLDGTIYNNLSVEMNNPDTPDDRIPDGALAIRGQPELAFALNNVSISASNSDNDSTSPLRFSANSIMTEIQAARDTGQHYTSIVVYDESGDAHTMTTIFTHSGTPGEWLWEVVTEGGEQILGGNTGHITFGQDGSPASFTFDDDSTTFRFDPMNGSNIVSIRLDVGSPGSFQGITQFRSESTTAAREQDGYPMGILQEISIDEFGEISGLYTNGVNKSIARIYVAEFRNPAGLLKLGDSMYGLSNNSGDAVLLRPGVGSSTKIKPGALEMSNVDLATEFTNMITTQRGYQANARVITTSDTLLQELVQLVR